MNININELAGQLYTTYCNAVGGKAFNGDDLPSWEDFSKDPAKKKQSDAWISTAIEALKRSSAIVRENFQIFLDARKGCRDALESIAGGLETCVAGTHGEPIDLRQIVLDNSVKDRPCPDWVALVPRTETKKEATASTVVAENPLKDAECGEGGVAKFTPVDLCLEKHANELVARILTPGLSEEEVNEIQNEARDNDVLYALVRSKIGELKSAARGVVFGRPTSPEA
jgi:hypothetical protein